ncbi:hypothetical protein M231_02860 [Tremella mesenterica]|uniref:Uncharacterized protein n=1 Tax=Tremella mesenterica TaxID=5217 RepID=A0A4Q1BPH3_TREME|nr:hypothetical protein M231_02860 [Tremella mesenterica]
MSNPGLHQFADTTGASEPTTISRSSTRKRKRSDTQIPGTSLETGPTSTVRDLIETKVLDDPRLKELLFRLAEATGPYSMYNITNSSPNTYHLTNFKDPAKSKMLDFDGSSAPRLSITLEAASTLERSIQDNPSHVEYLFEMLKPANPTKRMTGETGRKMLRIVSRTLTLLLDPEWTADQAYLMSVGTILLASLSKECLLIHLASGPLDYKQIAALITHVEKVKAHNESDCKDQTSG